MSTQKKAWYNVVILLVTFFMNFLGASGLINGMSQATVSDKYNTLITPAGFTFSIWGIIYSVLLIWVVYLAFQSKNTAYREIINAITPFYWVSLITNMIWIVTFSFEWLGMSTIFIFIYSLVLTACMNKIRTFKHPGQWFLAITFGLHTGWLLIASVLNVAAFLVQINWSGFGISDTVWTGLVMIVAMAIATFVTVSVKNAILPLPIAWAFFGIRIALIEKGGYTALELLAIVGIVVMLLVSIYTFIKNHKGILPKKDTI
ncbi:tryptophan-rich sensory protein [Carnobacterium sp. PL12RED10]|uniref:tryptophan-rich sensory protein n=1 Tax=Carnobacterium sp. PL12RED10 TaxID=2592351 RepID=UPI0011F01295|nr:tryptophan-rich sensory protein [Carnobacterium sp. PL12RED10]KAF3302258.1 tryptophan-rich sensory protein [Carnobacterium sp. PL12RED10]